MSPYQALFGKEPTMIPPYLPGEVSVEAVDTNLRHRDELIANLKKNLEQSRNRMKMSADKHRRERIFKEGDLVLVKLQPYRQISVARRACHKLSKRFFGPFPVQRVISSVAYQVALPENSRIHSTFHVSVLKAFSGNPPPHLPSLPDTSVDNHPVQHPIALLMSRSRMIGEHPHKEFLVQWSHSLPEDASWESASELARIYPNLDLEDKVSSEGGADVTMREVEVATVTKTPRPQRQKKASSWLKEFV